jgi:hypothetical protein
MTYNKVSIRKAAGGGAGTPTAKDPNVLFLRVRDLATDVNGNVTGFPTRDSQNVKSASGFTLKDGEKAQAIYVTPSTVNRFDNSEGDPDKAGWIQNFTAEHPGDELPFAEWLQNNLNEDFIIISKECGDGAGVRVHGTPCNPMKLQSEGQDNNEGKMSTLTFASVQRGKYKMMHYVHALPAVAEDYTEGSGSSGGGL